MGIILQTKVTDENRDKFYQQVYCQQFDSKHQLINLEIFSNECVLVDCCAWHYYDMFPNNRIIRLETVKNALQFKLSRNKFDKLVDDQQDHCIRWPSLDVVTPVVVFDRSPMLKYRSLANLTNLLTSVSNAYQASHLIINMNTTFIDDTRLVDRFYNMASINIPGFTVKEFVYSVSINKLFIHFGCNHVT
jgi:hypothetical protein